MPSLVHRPALSPDHRIPRPRKRIKDIAKNMDDLHQGPPTDKISEYGAAAHVQKVTDNSDGKSAKFLSLQWEVL